MVSVLSAFPSRNEFWGMVASSTVAVLLFAFVAIGSGAGFAIRSLVTLFAIFMLVNFITRQSADYTIGFFLVTLALVMVIADYLLPGFITSPFSFVTDTINIIVGIDLGAVEAWPFLVLSIASVFVVVAFRVRYSRAGVFIDRVFDRTLREFGKYIDNYLTGARLLVLFALGVGLMVASELGFITGFLGDVFSQVPFVVSSVVLGIAGYLSLGGDPVLVENVPLLGTLSAADFAVFAILVIAVAAATRFSSSGPLANLFK